METQFKPIYNHEKDIDLPITEPNDPNDEYQKLKRKILIRKIINRVVVFLILVLLIFWVFIRKSKNEVIKPDVVEPTPSIEQKEIPIVEEEEPKKDTPKTPLIPNVSPVNNTNNTKVTSKPKLATSEFDGFVTMNGGEPIFNLCGGNEDLLIIRNSPLYNQFYNRYTALAQGSYYARMYVVLKGHKVPVSYSGLGNSYTQGFYIEGINKMDFSGSCY